MGISLGDRITVMLSVGSNHRIIRALHDVAIVLVRRNEELLIANSRDLRSLVWALLDC